MNNSIKPVFEAVIGWDIDDESAMWGTGETPEAAALAAATEWQQFIQGGDEDPGVFEAIVYDCPVWLEDDEGTDHIVSHNGTQRVAVHITETEVSIVSG